MKLFKTTRMGITELCQIFHFCFELPSVLLKKEPKNSEKSTMNMITLAAIYR